MSPQASRTKRFDAPKNPPRITKTFQRWLLASVVVAFLATTVFLWFSQTKLSEDSALELLSINISDVQADIRDESDLNLLKLTHAIADEIDARDSTDSETLDALAAKYSVEEINQVDTNGMIIASTNKFFVGFDMRKGEQAAEFLVLLDGQTEFVQQYQPISYDASILRKYAGVTLVNGGFVEVGYDSGHFQRDIAEQVIGATSNRHVGESGCVIIADEQWNIVSGRHGDEGKNLFVSGIWIDTETMPQNERFDATVYGEPCYCMYVVSEGYYIVAAMPKSEAVLSRNMSVGVTTVMETLIFAALFILIYFLVKKLVVNNISRINGSLAQITDGNLSVTVDVRSNEEFDSLSTGINSTVDTLKRYIAEAAARIDQELEFARAIQLSALPSVFPPFPNRSEFEIWAGMATAKEVGGDFYDFYMIDDDTLVFLVADVSGKGIPAALFMMTSKTLIKSFAEAGAAVNEVFIRANEELCANNEAGMFVTAWMGFLDVRTGCVSFANAGHNPPLVRRADGDFEYLKCPAGFVLGGMEGIKYKECALQLEPGDELFLYTDGITEATDANNELYGEDRLLATLNATADLDAEALCKVVKADVDAFVGDAPQFDDITMLCVKYCSKSDGEESVQ